IDGSTARIAPRSAWIAALCGWSRPAMNASTAVVVSAPVAWRPAVSFVAIAGASVRRFVAAHVGAGALQLQRPHFVEQPVRERGARRQQFRRFLQRARGDEPVTADQFLGLAEG